MALQSEELFGSPVSQTANLRAYPDQDGVRPGQLEQLGADALLAHLIPMQQNPAGTYRVWGQAIIVDQVTTLTAASTTATDGTYTLTVDGETTGNLNHDDAAAVIQAALEALGVVDLGDVVVVDSGGGLASDDGVATMTWSGRPGEDIAVSATFNLTGADHVLAEATAGSGAGGSSEIDALLWAPGDPHQGLLAGETLMQRFLAGIVHAADVPLPAGESQGDLDTALKSMLLRQKGIKVQGLSLGA